jgi:hypothetical protein
MLKILLKEFLSSSSSSLVSLKARSIAALSKDGLFSLSN